MTSIICLKVVKYNDNAFYFPLEPDLARVGIDDIIEIILPLPKMENKTK